jgi:hypothetical protein
MPAQPGRLTEERREAMKPMKVTEVVGEHYSDIETDIIVESDGARVSTYRLRDMLPDGAEGKRGRWRITVEFEPIDGTAEPAVGV